MSLELEDGEIIEDVLIFIQIRVVTNKNEIEEAFHTMEEAEEYLGQVEQVR